MTLPLLPTPSDSQKSDGRPGQVDRPDLDIARLAHELRTPLGAIAVLAEMIRDERFGPLGGARYKAYAADIHSSAAHANAVLASWLESAGKVGPGEAGKLEFVELDLGPVVGSSLSALAPLCNRAGVKLEYADRQGLPHVIADRRSVRQMVTNLVSNALKFTPPGGMIKVDVTYVGGRSVVVEVSDTGDGMTAAELARARSTEAGGEALRLRSGGSGIGLPLVRTLAAASGARFEIDSIEQLGTTARVVFPHDRVVPV